MAQRIQDQTSYPLPAYNFRVSIGADEIGFSEVSGLTQEYEVLTYRHGLSFVEGETKLQVYKNKYVPVTLKRGMVQGLKQLSEWLDQKSARPMLVSLCNGAGIPAITWNIKTAIPVRLVGPTLSAGASSIAIESLEVLASGISVAHTEPAQGDM